MMRYYFLSSFILVALVGLLNPMVVMAAGGEEEMPLAWQSVHRQDLSLDPGLLRQTPSFQHFGGDISPLNVQSGLDQEIPVPHAMYPAPPTVAHYAVSPAVASPSDFSAAAAAAAAAAYAALASHAGPTAMSLDVSGSNQPGSEEELLDFLIPGPDTIDMQSSLQGSSMDADLSQLDMDALLTGFDTSVSSVQPLAQGSSALYALPLELEAPPATALGLPSLGDMADVDAFLAEFDTGSVNAQLSGASAAATALAPYEALSAMARPSSMPAEIAAPAAVKPAAAVMAQQAAASYTPPFSPYARVNSSDEDPDFKPDDSDFKPGDSDSDSDDSDFDSDDLDSLKASKQDKRLSRKKPKPYARPEKAAAATQTDTVKERKRARNKAASRVSRARQKRELEALAALSKINPEVAARRDAILLKASIDAAALQAKLQPKINAAKRKKNTRLVNTFASRISRVRQAKIDLLGLYEACESEGSRDTPLASVSSSGASAAASHVPIQKSKKKMIDQRWRDKRKTQLDALRALAETNPDVKARRDQVLEQAEAKANKLKLELVDEFKKVRQSKDRRPLINLRQKVSFVRQAKTALGHLYETLESEGFFQEK